MSDPRRSEIDFKPACCVRDVDGLHQLGCDGPEDVDPHAGESTSARLRRVEQERDELAVRAADLEQVRVELKQQRLVNEGLLADQQAWPGDMQELVDRSLALKAELASARTELERLRVRHAGGLAAGQAVADEVERLRSSPGWIVARDGGRTCHRCGFEITRGQAYELVQLDRLVHIHCPGVTP